MRSKAFQIYPILYIEDQQHAALVPIAYAPRGIDDDAVRPEQRMRNGLGCIMRFRAKTCQDALLAPLALGAGSLLVAPRPGTGRLLICESANALKELNIATLSQPMCEPNLIDEYISDDTGDRYRSFSRDIPRATQAMKVTSAQQAKRHRLAPAFVTYSRDGIERTVPQPQTDATSSCSWSVVVRDSRTETVLPTRAKCSVASGSSKTALSSPIEKSEQTRVSKDNQFERGCFAVLQSEWMTRELLSSGASECSTSAGNGDADAKSSTSAAVQAILCALTSTIEKQPPPWSAEIARAVLPLYVHPNLQVRTWVLAVISHCEAADELQRWLADQLAADNGPLLDAMRAAFHPKFESERERLVAIEFWANLVRLLGRRGLGTPGIARRLLNLYERALADARPSVHAAVLRAWHALIGVVLDQRLPKHEQERSWIRVLLQPIRMTLRHVPRTELILTEGHTPSERKQVRQALIDMLAFFCYRYLRYTDISIRSATARIFEALADFDDDDDDDVGIDVDNPDQRNIVFSSVLEHLFATEQVREALLLAALHRDWSQTRLAASEFAHATRTACQPDQADSLVDELFDAHAMVVPSIATRQRADRQLIAREWLSVGARDLTYRRFGELLVLALHQAGDERPLDPSRSLLVQRSFTTLFCALNECSRQCEKSIGTLLDQLTETFTRYPIDWTLLASPCLSVVVPGHGDKRQSPALLLLWLVAQRRGSWPPWLDALALALPDFWSCFEVLTPVEHTALLQHLAQLAARRVTMSNASNESEQQQQQQRSIAVHHQQLDTCFALVFQDPASSLQLPPAMYQNVPGTLLAHRLQQYRHWVPVPRAIALLPWYAVAASEHAPELIHYLYRLDPENVHKCLRAVAPPLAARLRRLQAREPVSILKTSPATPSPAVCSRRRFPSNDAWTLTDSPHDQDDTVRDLSAKKTSRHVRFEDEPGLERLPSSPLSSPVRRESAPCSSPLVGYTL